jgi:uncharacterized protein with HEPN domain
MPDRGWVIRVSDILDAIAVIKDYTAGMDYQSFAADRKTVDAVLHNIMTIGEAATRVPDEVMLLNPDIPWRDMRDMRNIIVHEYFGVNTRIVWDTSQHNLPGLVVPLRRLLDQQSDDSKP